MGNQFIIPDKAAVVGVLVVVMVVISIIICSLYYLYVNYVEQEGDSFRKNEARVNNDNGWYDRQQAAVYSAPSRNNEAVHRRVNNDSGQYGGQQVDSGGQQVVPEGHKMKLYIDRAKYYSEEDAASKAIEAKGYTILRTNNGKLYNNSRDGSRHAEECFIEDTPYPNGITGIWLTNSPCSNCAGKLIEKFKGCDRKPCIFVGHVYYEQNNEEKRKEKMREMKNEGFTFLAWEKYCTNKATLDITRRDIQDNLS